MACYHPLKAFPVGIRDTGTTIYKVTSYDTECVLDRNGKLVTESIDIPCGHCVGCLLHRSKEWADRCMLEAKYHEQNSFITLTYDDEHIKQLYHLDDSDKLIDKDFYSLNKRHLQLFFKRLRERLSPIKIRYFACGEYGSRSFRPHYHAIIFGYDFSSDRTYYKRNFNGDILYNSPLLSDCWPYGYSVIADVSWNTCAYVSRYCLKKRNNDISPMLNSLGLDPEYVVMSRRPGIARQYYDDNARNIYRTDSIVLDKGKICKPPKYFDRLYDLDYPSDMDLIKEHRVYIADLTKQMELDKTDLDYLDYLKVKEYNYDAKTKILNERSDFL